MSKLFIYEFPEVESFIESCDPSVPEMDVFDLFVTKMKQNYKIVSDIKEAEIAFININIVRILYTVRDNPSNKFLCGSSQFGSESKKKVIQFYFRNIINPVLNHNVPTFMIYNYVLFDTDLNDIPSFIKILSYETKVTIFQDSHLRNNGTYNRMVMIPYILNENKVYNQNKIYTMISHKDYKKKYNVAFFGTIEDDVRLDLCKYRRFLNHLHFDLFGSYIKGSGKDAFINLKDVKYLFVLRGDTPTRLCFYQCFPHLIIPIIPEKVFEEYNNLLLMTRLRDSVFVIPDQNDLSDVAYASLVQNLLLSELKNELNYYKKIQNHENIFYNLNYFHDGLPQPIRNAINEVDNNNNILICASHKNATTTLQYSFKCLLTHDFLESPNNIKIRTLYNDSFHKTFIEMSDQIDIILFPFRDIIPQYISSFFHSLCNIDNSGSPFFHLLNEFTYSDRETILRFIINHVDINCLFQYYFTMLESIKRNISNENRIDTCNHHFGTNIDINNKSDFQVSEIVINNKKRKLIAFNIDLLRKHFDKLKSLIFGHEKNTTKLIDMNTSKTKWYAAKYNEFIKLFSEYTHVDRQHSNWIILQNVRNSYSGEVNKKGVFYGSNKISFEDALRVLENDEECNQIVYHKQSKCIYPMKEIDIIYYEGRNEDDGFVSAVKINLQKINKKSLRKIRASHVKKFKNELFSFTKNNITINNVNNTYRNVILFTGYNTTIERQWLNQIVLSQNRIVTHSNHFLTWDNYDNIMSYHYEIFQQIHENYDYMLSNRDKIISVKTKTTPFYFLNAFFLINVGHAFSIILDHINYIKENKIKEVIIMKKYKDTSLFKLVELLLPPDIIFHELEFENMYTFEDIIIVKPEFYAILKHPHVINDLKQKIDKQGHDKLKGRNLILIKNKQYGSDIHHFECRTLIEELRILGFEFIIPENENILELVYSIMHANNIIFSDGAIVYFNKIFLNKYTHIYFLVYKDGSNFDLNFTPSFVHKFMTHVNLDADVQQTNDIIAFIKGTMKTKKSLKILTGNIPIVYEKNHMYHDVILHTGQIKFKEWESCICTKFINGHLSILRDSNIYLQDKMIKLCNQDSNNEHFCNIYENIESNYDDVLNTSIFENTYDDVYFYMMNPFSLSNSGHDLSINLNNIDFILKNNIKNVITLEEYKQTHNFKLIQLLLCNRVTFIFLKSGTMYKFERMIIIEQVHYDIFRHSYLIKKLNNLIHEMYSNVYNDYKNKKILLIKTLDNPNIFRTDTAFDCKSWIQKQKDYVFIVPEEMEIFKLVMYLKNAKQIIFSGGSILYTNQIFFNENADLIFIKKKNLIAASIEQLLVRRKDITVVEIENEKELDQINFSSYNQSIPHNFDWQFYTTHYKDLQRAKINTQRKAQLHYIRHGRKEGRVYNSQCLK